MIGVECRIVGPRPPFRPSPFPSPPNDVSGRLPIVLRGRGHRWRQASCRLQGASDKAQGAGCRLQVTRRK